MGKHKVSFVSGFVWRFGGDYFSGGDYFFQRVARNKAERHSHRNSFTSWAHIGPLRLSAAGFGDADDYSVLHYRRSVYHGVVV